MSLDFCCVASQLADLSVSSCRSIVSLQHEAAYLRTGRLMTTRTLRDGAGNSRKNEALGRFLRDKTCAINYASSRDRSRVGRSFDKATEMWPN